MIEVALTLKNELMYQNTRHNIIFFSFTFCVEKFLELLQDILRTSSIFYACVYLTFLEECWKCCFLSELIVFSIYQVMYRPLKDLNGIPGAKDLVVCLTGYLRQDRDDIMVSICFTLSY